MKGERRSGLGENRELDRLWLGAGEDETSGLTK
jgi:hypothetical protein